MPKPREDKEQIISQAKELLAQGKTITEISKEISVPYGTISTYLKNEQKEQVVNSVDAGKKSPHPTTVPSIADQFAKVAEEKLLKSEFSELDEEPIPYLVVADPIAGLKVDLIGVVLERGRESDLSDTQLLNVIQGIQGLTA